MNLASKCNMTVNDNKTVEYLSANSIRSTTLGCASGVLALNVGSLAIQVFLRIELQIIPGTNNLLIGRDLLQTLGLRTEHGFNLYLDHEHRTILNAECEFDNRICQPIRFIEQLSNKSDLGNEFGHSTFRHDLDELGCRMCLDDIRDEERQVVLLEKYRNVFSGLPHPDGIDCQLMTISFYDESKVVKRKPRRLNPEKQRAAEEIFNELIRNGFAVPAKSQFSSPICLVIYPDHRKPQLTGDFSGIGGVNDLTKPVEANLPRPLMSNATSVSKRAIRPKGVPVKTAKGARNGESNKLNCKLEEEVLEVLVSVVEEVLAAEAEALLTINVPVTIYVL
ncbi:hypothetical protein P9112_005717 [Eukaryota sp. TZLM1-RC]